MSRPTLAELIDLINRSGAAKWDGSGHVRDALTEIDRRLTALERPRVGAWLCEFGVQNAYDDHGRLAAQVFQAGPGWGWTANRAFLPPTRSLGSKPLATEAEALAAATAALATWADVEPSK